MPRTAFYSQLKPPSQGATTYTVPAGKFVVCNALLLLPGGSSTVAPLDLTLNGVQVISYPVTAAFGFPTQGRVGPLVFNAGDVIGNASVQSGGGGVPITCGLVGFLYDVSARKAPLNQKLVTGTTSYTVPVGKHAVVNIFQSGAGGGAIVSINGIDVATVGATQVFAFPSSPFGPFTLASGAVISTRGFNPQYQNVGFGLMTGFLYNY